MGKKKKSFITIRAMRTGKAKRITEVFYRALFPHETPTEGKLFSREAERGGLLGNISNATY